MSETKFQKLVNNNFLFRLYLLKSLPLAFIAGIRVKGLTNEKAVTTVRYGWLTQNPFRSMYFACQAMAAEMCSGMLAFGQVYKRNPKISMLVVKMEVNFIKKATGTILFTCEDGALIQAAINESIETGEGKTIVCLSKGKNSANETVAEFLITWSFKAKKS